MMTPAFFRSLLDQVQLPDKVFDRIVFDDEPNSSASFELGALKNEYERLWKASSDFCNEMLKGGRRD